MKALMHNWNLPGDIRLVMGFALMIQGTVEKNYWFELAGLLLLAVAILNKGCCGSSACANQ
jgi:hypothetical protein